MVPYKGPAFQQPSFNCPHCGAYSHQIWQQMCRIHGAHNAMGDLLLAMCSQCDHYSLWLNGKMVYPEQTGVTFPNDDLKEEIKADYNEARAILQRSPRGAAALLRLCVQKVCEQLGEPGRSINDDISSLVKKGLPATIQKALDIVRVIGNNAVHPGQIDLKDDLTTANKLFELVNLIAQVMITQPKEIEKLYGALPESQRKAIEQLDKP